MRAHAKKSILLGLLGALLLGCGGDSSDPTEPSAPEVEGATLALTEAASFDRVAVLGLDPPEPAKLQIGDYRVQVSADGGESFEQILDYDEDGWFFRAPLHPVNPFDFGTVQVRITDGERSSDAHDLDVQALPSSPGSFASLVATIEEYLELRAGWAGTTLADLKALPAVQASPGVLPLKLGQEFLDSENDPNDLKDLVANADEFLSPQEADLLDRIFGAFELESLVRADIEAGAGLGELPALPAGARAAGKVCFNGGPEDIDSAPLLSIYMTRSAVASFGADPNSEAGRTLEFGATVLTGASVLPGYAGKVAGVGCVAIAAVQGLTQAAAGLLPSYFESIEFDVDKTEFNEDSEEFATYDNVKVVAASTGWVADKSVVNIAVNAMWTYTSLANKLQIEGSGLAANVGFLGLGVGANDLFEDTDILEFCPQTWEVDISSPQYCTAAALNHRFDVDIPNKKVTPKEYGVDTLEVAAQSTQFGNREISDTVQMEVLAIKVEVTPQEKNVETPGETINIAATIENADLTTLRWTAEEGTWEDGLSDETNSGGTRPLKTPTNPEAYPFRVTVESISDKGARASGEPVRDDFMVVRYQGAIRIEPPFACISPGETQQFEAIVVGQDDYTVEWSLGEYSYGSIDQNGLYTSLPSGTSSAEIIAKLVGIEDAEAKAQVEVGPCNCSLKIDISGASSWQRESAQAAYQVVNFGAVIYQFWLNFDATEDYPAIQASLVETEEQPAPQIGDTDRNFPVSFVYTNGVESWTAGQEDELAGVTLHIDSLTESEMVGRMNGTAVIRDGDDVVSTVIVDVTFKAGYWGGIGTTFPCN